jgi:subtilisin family serine protease
MLFNTPKTALFLFFFVLAAASHAQPPARPVPANWHLLHPATDSVQGVSAEKAHAQWLQGRTAVPVIVAVIDSGIDTDHEDLKDVLWVNPKEIPGNQRDDDGNGYVDDIHGWNFIGGKDGRNVNEDTYELTREYIRLSARFGKTAEGQVAKRDKKDFEEFKQIGKKYLQLKEKNEEKYNTFKNLYLSTRASTDSLKAFLKTDTLTQEKLAGVQSADPVIVFGKNLLTHLMQNIGGSYPSIDAVLDDLKEYYNYYRVIVEHGYNATFDSREIVGDDISNLKERHYGNSDVKGPDPMHGTHVAGIIAANRQNNLGINGIAAHVQIMAVRAVPNGDERDKDVANAIYYAVDNGAQIINMSFGKSYSPQKEAVDRAVQYAERKGVLLVHAAGNDGDNTDEKKNYPSRFYANGKAAANWIEVGASGWYAGPALAAEFSNYGKKSVDLFAPGVAIYSTVPGNRYNESQGTSMAAPVVSGVAAVLKSYFPDLTAVQLREIILQSARNLGHVRTTRPGSDKQVSFGELSTTGGIVDLFEALEYAKRTNP